MAREIELKLAFAPAAHAAILAHPLLARAERLGAAKELINTYYDTPDMALSARRVALRTRKIGDTWLQTVKCAAESFGGLSSRPEWEQRFTGEFDFSAVDAEAPRKLLEAHRGAIVPLFTTNFHRQTLLLTPSADVRVLVMIDSGEVSANGRSEAISELELELEHGSADDLLAIASELAASLPLLPYDPSKAARGYRLFRGDLILPEHHRISPANPKTQPLAAFSAAAFTEIAAWAANQHAAISSDNAEFVHQLRLALRRLRSLIRLFAPLLPESFTAHWQATLRREAASLAEARDLDVLCDEILAVTEGDSDARLPALLTHASAARQHAHAAVRARLAAPGAGQPLLALTRALHALPQAEAQMPLEAFAAQALARLQRQAQRRYRSADTERSTEALHALRIATRRLRLGQELFAATLDKKQAATTNSLAELQADLGHLHDLALAMPRLADFSRSRPELTEAVAFVVGWQAATSLQLRRAILPRCRKLLGKKHTAGK
ncbi:CYTH and CHAD domain-containing protein [Uliginosibacterium aquaticum]|uniref:CYTH and CHAD domain-containing protein n=1 Tax=Uliginosibacterium aquaticum TaxID=2731212 RepID=A0ABX2IHL5_9RHOO|nr:CYTH and CHAD domain-containing protein [Uliginosibacterium aquaticum]NSL55378.1 CYTH and CHAD domain-containing protein [Uliginosibacterium aquaticum]